jgi:hypothetical protein
MAGKTLTTASILQCPHGGRVTVLSSYPQAGACESPIATVGDTFVIAGCPHHIFAGVPVPSPCATVRWLVADTVMTVGGHATLSEGSAGLCLSAAQIPQGAVIVQQTQTVLGTR